MLNSRIFKKHFYCLYLCLCVRACTLYCLCSPGSDGEPSLSPGLMVKWLLGRTPPSRVMYRAWVYVSMYVFVLFHGSPHKGVSRHTQFRWQVPFCRTNGPGRQVQRRVTAGPGCVSWRSDGRSTFSGSSLPLHDFICI